MRGRGGSGPVGDGRTRLGGGEKVETQGNAEVKRRFLEEEERWRGERCTGVLDCAACTL